MPTTESADNPYRTPEGNLDRLDRSDPTEDELRAFFGEDADYYLASWRMQAEGGWWAGFNWAAFFLFFLWSLYRKLYLVFACVFVVNVLIQVALASLPDIFAWVLRLGILASLGALGNYLYLRRARSVIARYQRLEADPDARIQLISSAGGTSRIAVGIGIVLLVGPQLLPAISALPYYALIAGVVYWLSTRPGADAGVLNLYGNEEE